LAIFGSTYGTGIRTITVNAPATVGHMLFDSPVKYTIGASGGTTPVTFQVSSGVDTARILALQGSHDFNAPVSLASTLTVEVADAVRTVAFLGTVTGSGGLVKVGPGAMTLRAAANTYTGGTTVLAGRLTVPNTGGSLGPGLLTVASGATVNLQVPTVTVSGLSGSGTINLGFASPVTNTTLRVQGTASSAFSGRIQDVTGAAGRLEVGGGATLDLRSQNTHSGGTTINTGGRIEVSHPLCLGTGPLTLNGGTLARPPLAPGLLGRYYHGYDSPGGAPAWMNTLATVQQHLATVTPNHVAPTTTGGQADLFFRDNAVTGAIYRSQGFTRQYN
jgi:autotransporter-associated beta strand protein